MSDDLLMASIKLVMVLASWALIIWLAVLADNWWVIGLGILLHAMGYMSRAMVE